MSGPYRYGITTDALDELGRLEYIAAFISDAICSIADSVETGGGLAKKSWLGLYYLSQYMEGRITAIHSQCGSADLPPAV